MALLNERNTIQDVYDYVHYLPKPFGRRNVHKLIHVLKHDVLTPAAGDRPDAPNICIFLTSGYRYLAHKLKKWKLGKICHHTIILNRGYLSDLHKIRDHVCSAFDSIKGT